MEWLSKLELRSAARKEVEKFDAVSDIAESDKKYWLITTVPEVPVAGEDCIVYLNRQQTDALRQRPRVMMHYGFNRFPLDVFFLSVALPWQKF